MCCWGWLLLGLALVELAQCLARGLFERPPCAPVYWLCFLLSFHFRSSIVRTRSASISTRPRNFLSRTAAGHFCFGSASCSGVYHGAPLIRVVHGDFSVDLGVAVFAFEPVAILYFLYLKKLVSAENHFFSPCIFTRQTKKLCFLPSASKVLDSSNKMSRRVASSNS